MAHGGCGHCQGWMAKRGVTSRGSRRETSSGCLLPGENQGRKEVVSRPGGGDMPLAGRAEGGRACSSSFALPFLPAGQGMGWLLTFTRTHWDLGIIVPFGAIKPRVLTATPLNR